MKLTRSSSARAIPSSRAPALVDRAEARASPTMTSGRSRVRMLGVNMPPDSGIKRRRLCSTPSAPSVPVQQTFSHATLPNTSNTSVRRRLWPMPAAHSSTRQEANNDMQPGLSIVDGWNQIPCSRFPLRSMQIHAEGNAWESDSDDDLSQIYRSTFPSSRAGPAAIDKDRTRDEAGAAIHETVDQVRYVGTHLSAKYGLDDMFRHARSLLVGSGGVYGASRRRPHRGTVGAAEHDHDYGNDSEADSVEEVEQGREGSGADVRQVPLGGLSFFLGCPKRHPKLPATMRRSPRTALGFLAEPTSPKFGSGGDTEETPGDDEDRAWWAKVELLKRGVADLEEHSQSTFLNHARLSVYFLESCTTDWRPGF
jgi:hypothetical protein